MSGNEFGARNARTIGFSLGPTPGALGSEAAIDAAVQPFLPQAPQLSMSLIHHRYIVPVVIVLIILVVAVVTLSVFLAVGKHNVFVPVWEHLPMTTAPMLMCPDHSKRYWALDPTNQEPYCIFSGDMSLSGGRGIQESDVQALCNSMMDCHGYTVQSVASYMTCGAVNAPGDSNTYTPGFPTSCVMPAYNKGQPEYRLFGKASLANLQSVPASAQGVQHNIRSVTYRRM